MSCCAFHVHCGLEPKLTSSVAALRLCCVGWLRDLLHSVRQQNKANGKLRPNAVPPRHDRIVQLGARDGSDEKYEAKAKREREDAQAILAGKQLAKDPASEVAGQDVKREDGADRRSAKRARRAR